MSDFLNRKLEVITGGRKFMYPELNMKFEVKFDSDQEPNEAQITIYNLSEDSVSSIISGNQIIINAGYGDDVGGILSGTIESVSSVRSRTDKKTTIKALDISGNYMKSLVSKTYNPNTTAEFVIRDLLESFGIKPSLLELSNNTVYENGYVANGRMKDILQAIVSECGSELIIKNSTIEISIPEKGTTTGFLLNYETGLLSVEKIDKKNSKAQYKVKMLLNHNINCKSLLRIESYIFTGNVIVLEGKHKDFKTEVEVATYG